MAASGLPFYATKFRLFMNNDIALSALVMLAQYHGIAVSPKDIEHQFDPERKGISEKAWVLADRKSVV